MNTLALPQENLHHRDTEDTEGHRELICSVALCALCVSVVKVLLTD